MFDKTCLNEVVEHPNAQNWDVLAIFEPGKQPEVSPMSEYLHAGEYSFVANIGNGPACVRPECQDRVYANFCGVVALYRTQRAYNALKTVDSPFLMTSRS